MTRIAPTIVGLCFAGPAIFGVAGCSGNAPQPPTKPTTVPTKSSADASRDESIAASELVENGAKAAEPPADPNWGTLKGQFIYNGKAPVPKPIDATKEPMCVPHKLVDESLVVGAGGGIKDAVIYVRTKEVKVHPALDNPPAEVVLDNKNCRFEPHMLPMLVSQTLVVANSDPIGHNAKIDDIVGGGANPMLAPNAKSTYKFKQESVLPITVSCNIHGWMSARVLPRDNPYFAVSDADGKFEIKDLPVGMLEFQVWHEKAGNFKNAAREGWTKGLFNLDIQPGDNDLGARKFDPQLFNK